MRRLVGLTTKFSVNHRLIRQMVFNAINGQHTMSIPGLCFDRLIKVIGHIPVQVNKDGCGKFQTRFEKSSGRDFGDWYIRLVTDLKEAVSFRLRIAFDHVQAIIDQNRECETAVACEVPLINPMLFDESSAVSYFGYKLIGIRK